MTMSATAALFLSMVFTLLAVVNERAAFVLAGPIFIVVVCLLWHEHNCRTGYRRRHHR